MTIDRRVLKEVPFPSDASDPFDSFLEACCRAEISLCSADPYNYVRTSGADVAGNQEAGDGKAGLSDVIF